VYEKILEEGAKPQKNLYRGKLIKVPLPEFIVLYNGAEPYPDQVTLKLSDCFEALENLTGKTFAPPELELTVKVYNINHGHNEEIARRSGKLEGYSVFVGKVRENRETMGPEEAMKAAIEYCLKHNVLRAFLAEHSSEVMNMLLTEWNIDDAKEVWYEEGLEDGLEKGREEGREEGEVLGIVKGREEGREEGIEAGRREAARKALSRGLSVEVVQEITGLSPAEIARL
ncbi:MAG: hypothetical protein LBQ61_02920, partial [Spirochaetales bacterium]|jgi:hypothetical protein|nr:hypothetical protein [Spirochaetales bacterium]